MTTERGRKRNSIALVKTEKTVANKNGFRTGNILNKFGGVVSFQWYNTGHSRDRTDEWLVT